MALTKKDLEQSVSQLQGVIKSKDEAIADQSVIIDKQREKLDELMGRLEEQQDEINELSDAIVKAEGISLDPQATPPLPLFDDQAGAPETLPDDEQAVAILKDLGFEVLLDVLIEDCREEDGSRRRSFKRRGRYEVVLARGRKRL